jgi:hypothetical protein
MKICVLVLILALFAQTVFVQTAFAQDEEAFSSSSEVFMQISSLPEAKIGFTQRFVFPFLQSDNPLMENNNISLALTAEVSPISFNAIAGAVLTPIAFLEFSAGARIGTGWMLNLFGSDIYGTGLNIQGDNGESVHDGSAFDSLMWKVHLAGTFQFDLAAIFPGDWNHVVFLTNHEINYHGNTRAAANESWYFESDDGENVNGFNYYGNFLIGYQMPIMLNMVALLAEMELHLYNMANRSNWGDDLIRWTFSGIFSFEITEQFGIAVLAQFRTRRNYTNFDESAAGPHLYYRERILNTSNPLRLEFYRVAAALTYKF